MPTVSIRFEDDGEIEFRFVSTVPDYEARRCFEEALKMRREHLEKNWTDGIECDVFEALA